MGTLYDLLGALPGDDADGLRAAFRRAAKATHPDIHPEDPDAARRFRELVRAYDILTDGEQRTTYDQLLCVALHPPAPKSTRVYETVRKLASNTMAATIISGVLIGGYTLFGLISNRPGAAEILLNGAAGQQTALAASSEAAIAPPADAEVVKEMIVMAALNDGGMPPGRIIGLAPSFAPNTPLTRRDPLLAAGYLDRDIILYRTPKFDRAFDTMVQARRAGDTSRSTVSAPAPRKPSAARIPEARIPEARISQARIPSPKRRTPVIAALTP
jgi:hypothetical protein